MLRKLLFVSCWVVLGLSVVVGSASAQATCNDPAPFPANSQAICEGMYGGTFAESGPPPTNTCTVVGATSVLTPVAPGCNEASHAAGFKAKYQVTKTTIYTRRGGGNGNNCSVEEITDSTLVACYNSQGKPTSLKPCICPNGDS